jgi:hypothetical protein
MNTNLASVEQAATFKTGVEQYLEASPLDIDADNTEVRERRLVGDDKARALYHLSRLGLERIVEVELCSITMLADFTVSGTRVVPGFTVTGLQAYTAEIQTSYRTLSVADESFCTLSKEVELLDQNREYQLSSDSIDDREAQEPLEPHAVKWHEAAILVDLILELTAGSE